MDPVLEFADDVENLVRPPVNAIMRSMSTLTMPNRHPELEADAFSALTTVQRAIRQMMRSLPGPFERPSQLQHCLGIDAKVAWHIFKLAAAKGPLAAAPHVPGPLLMRRIGDTALSKGVPESIVESARIAISNFDMIVKQHASTRSAFKAILATAAGEKSAETMALQQRHTAFNMESQLWGEQVDLHFTQAIFMRQSQWITLKGGVTYKAGLQLLRSDTSPVVEGYSNFAARETRVQPLDPEALAKYGSSLLPRFCSQPIPQFRIEDRINGWRYSLIENNSIGRQGAVDLAFGRVMGPDRIDCLKSGVPIVVNGTRFISPTATAVLELLIHRSSFPGVEPQFASFGDLTVNSMESLVDYGRRLPSFGILQKVGNAAKATLPPHSAIPCYNELQGYVFSKLKWKRSEFDVYRISISYPILHTMGTIWFEV